MPVNEVSISMTPDGRLDSTDAAAYLQISKHTMARWRSEGHGPKFLKLGHIFYYLKDLDNWLQAAGKSQSASEARRKQHGE